MEPTITSYELINNHYIVYFNGLRYLLDTGNCNSYSYHRNINSIEINNIKYPLIDNSNATDMDEIENVIGIKIDGIIGMDIIRKTSLTIYKNGLICFKCMGIKGYEIKLLHDSHPLIINAQTAQISGGIIIDTGARYGYGIKSLFTGISPFEEAVDYNPQLKTLHSPNYQLNLSIDGISYRPVTACYNKRVEEWCLNAFEAFMVINITDLFDYAIEFNMEAKKLIIN